MDSMKKGILNLFESVIQNVFIREPNINAIQEWVSSCDQNKGGITTPPVTPPESRIQIDSAEKKSIIVAMLAVFMFRRGTMKKKWVRMPERS